MKSTLLLAAMSLTLMHCGKPKTPTYSVNSDLKAAFNYKPGTYWIYKDLLTGRLDSFAVIRNSLTTVSKGGTVNIEQINIFISEYQISPILSASNHSFQYIYQVNEFDLLDENNLPSNELVFGPLINYPFSTTITTSGTFSSPSFTDTSFKIPLLNSYNINGRVYNNVAKISCRENYVNSIDDIFYLTPDAGFIKMTFSQSQDSLNYIW